ncbi:MAG: heparinase II/III family protein [Magnetococcales bacterium]|nr:heparinase II/III family protein [Magnetococcales bacterium]
MSKDKKPVTQDRKKRRSLRKALRTRIRRHLITTADRKVRKVVEKALPTFTKPDAKVGFLTPLLRQRVTVPKAQEAWLIALTERFLAHRFDLLGSGWVLNRYGVGCSGTEGVCYSEADVLSSQPEDCARRVNRANREISFWIRSVIDRHFEPLDWQRDLRSGYRWSEESWHGDIRYMRKDMKASIHPGVDVKFPWEMGRMQHLPALALAYEAARRDRPGFCTAEMYRLEFCHTFLDFHAANPPRYGVQWSSPMDVAIRAVTLIFTRELFRTAGALFSEDFEHILTSSIEDHLEFTYKELEYWQELRGNHYLANIAGIVIMAAALPQSPKSDARLAFGIRELIHETQCQFHPDGANFEGSTSYHRLSAEAVLYASSVVLGLSRERLTALQNYDHTLHKRLPKLPPGPLPMYPREGFSEELPSPPASVETEIDPEEVEVQRQQALREKRRRTLKRQLEALERAERAARVAENEQSDDTTLESKRTKQRKKVTQEEELKAIGVIVEKMVEAVESDTEEVSEEPQGTPSSPEEESPGPEETLIDASLTPLPGWMIQRLRQMARFAGAISKPHGRIIQIGDNDNGRFFKLLATSITETVDSSRSWERTTNAVPTEDHLNHRELHAALDSLFDTPLVTNTTHPVSDLIQGLTGGRFTASIVESVQSPPRLVSDGTEEAMSPLPPSDEITWGELEDELWRLGKNRSLDENFSHQVVETHFPLKGDLLGNLRHTSYPGFGLHCIVTDGLWLAVRCGPPGQNGNGGHDHRDQLHMELTLRNKDIVRDPGTGYYTPVPELRNAYRGAEAHYTAVPKGWSEANPLPWLFQLRDHFETRVLYLGPEGFVGEHTGYGFTLRRWVVLKPHLLRVVDVAMDAPEDLSLVVTVPPTTHDGKALAFSPGYGQFDPMPVEKRLK